MRAVILSGGTIDEETVRRQLLGGAPYRLIAADRGVAFCRAQGLTPDYIVGDFDSLGAADCLRAYRAQGVPIDTFRPEKDMTDTDIAVEKAIAIGADEVWLFGATGTRLDHSLSNIFNLYKLYAHGMIGILFDAHNKIYLPLTRRVTMRRAQQYGGFVSLFPLRGEVTGLTLTGFKYPLTDATIVQGDGGLTVSNEIVADQAIISWEAGLLLVMETAD